jgi:hypothetical protein
MLLVAPIETCLRIDANRAECAAVTQGSGLAEWCVGVERSDGTIECERSSLRRDEATAGDAAAMLCADVRAIGGERRLALLPRPATPAPPLALNSTTAASPRPPSASPISDAALYIALAAFLLLLFLAAAYMRHVCLKRQKQPQQPQSGATKRQQLPPQPATSDPQQPFDFCKKQWAGVCVCVCMCVCVIYNNTY